MSDNSIKEGVDMYAFETIYEAFFGKSDIRIVVDAEMLGANPLAKGKHANAEKALFNNAIELMQWSCEELNQDNDICVVDNNGLVCSPSDFVSRLQGEVK